MGGIAALLSRHGDLDRLIRPRVEAATAGMTRGCKPNKIDLAGACLGNSFETVRALMADGSLPHLLDQPTQDRAASSMKDELQAYVDVLALPRGRNVETIALPTRSSRGTKRPCSGRGSVGTTSRLSRYLELPWTRTTTAKRVLFVLCDPLC